MKRVIFLFLTLILLFPLISAVNVQIEKLPETRDVIIEGINNPAVFYFKITNTGNTGNFILENNPDLFTITPVEFSLNRGESKKIEVKVYADKNLRYTKPFYGVDFFIKQGDAQQQKELTVKMVELQNVLQITSDSIDPESKQATIYIKNKENIDLDGINIDVSSIFFNANEKISLNSKEETTLVLPIDSEKFTGVTAGYYTIANEIEIYGKKTLIDGKIEFIEKNLVISEGKDYGFLIVTKIISKTNKGNVLVESDTSMKKNIISRLFTTFSPTPSSVKRQGFDVYYYWYNEIRPNEKLEIKATTNWFFPIIIIALIIASVVFAKRYSKTNLILRKKVGFIRTSGGEFALKISLIASAKSHLERISIIDRLPALVKIHEKFGSESPSRIDEKNKRIEWDVHSLEKGEVRVFSYVVYSKVGILGKFALPSARAVYEINGKIEEVTSNRAFFLAEQKKGQVEED